MIIMIYANIIINNNYKHLNYLVIVTYRPTVIYIYINSIIIVYTILISIIMFNSNLKSRKNRNCKLFLNYYSHYIQATITY